MRLLHNILGALFALLLVAFAVFNRQNVAFVYSPFHDPLELPLYLIALGLMGIGFIAGGAAVWLNMAGLRRARRQQRKTIKALEKELETANTAPQSPSLPVLPQLAALWPWQRP